MSSEGEGPEESQTESLNRKPSVSSEEMAALIEKLPTFLEQFRNVGQENLSKANKEVPHDVIEGHRKAWAATIGMVRRLEKRTVSVPLEKDAHFIHRMVLVISFLQGISLCYEAIGNGLYLQAAGLLRQEMETIAALAEARRTGEVKKITGRGQQVGKGNVAWEMNRLHGLLSSATHLTDPKLLDGLYRSVATSEEGLPGRPVRLMPLYSKADITHFWAFQTGLILQLFQEAHLVLMNLFGEGANEVETSAWNAAVDSLQKAGFLVEEKPKK